MILCQSTINWPMPEAGFIIIIIIIIIITKPPGYMASKTLHVVVQCQEFKAKDEKLPWPVWP